jgi:hypothetical protein
VRTPAEIVRTSTTELIGRPARRGGPSHIRARADDIENLTGIALRTIRDRRERHVDAFR